MDVDDMKTFNQEYDRVHIILEDLESCYTTIKHYAESLQSEELKGFCKDLIDNPIFKDETHQVESLELYLEDTYNDNEERINEQDSIDRAYDRKMWEDDRL